MFYVATKWGFITDPDSKTCSRDVREAYPFNSFTEADTGAKKLFGFTYFAIMQIPTGEKIQ